MNVIDRSFSAEANRIKAGRLRGAAGDSCSSLPHR